MQVKDFIEQIKTLEREIEGCDNLIEFYQFKKEKLQKELKNLYDMSIFFNNEES